MNIKDFEIDTFEGYNKIIENINYYSNLLKKKCKEGPYFKKNDNLTFK